ncbi:MAG: hypothetical protein V3V01_01110 [Acidimicrobiales bacterium]
MKFIKQFKPSPALVVALFALFFAMGGTAMAQALIGSDDVIDGSLTGDDIKNNSIRSKDVKGIRGVDIKNGSLTTKDVRNGTLLDEDIANVSGAKVIGPVADAAKLDGQDSTDFQAKVKWALIAADGSIIEQSGGISLTSVGLGTYYINMGESVDNTAILGNLQWGSDGEFNATRCGPDSPAETGCFAAGTNNDSHIFVTTNDSAGATSAAPFYVAVIG